MLICGNNDCDCHARGSMNDVGRARSFTLTTRQLQLPFTVANESILLMLQPCEEIPEAANEESISDLSYRDVAISSTVAYKNLVLTPTAAAGSRSTGRASLRVMVTMHLSQREAMNLRGEMVYAHMMMFTEQAAAQRYCSGRLGEVCLTQPPGCKSRLEPPLARASRAVHG